MANPRILLSPQFSYVGATETITLPMAFNNRSNVAVGLSIEHEMRGPGGTIISSGVTTYSLIPEDTTPGITLATFNHTFSESGDYSVQVKVFNGSNLLGSATNAISVTQSKRIEPNKILTPVSAISQQPLH